MKTPKGFFTYFHHEAVLNALTDAQAGRLYKSLLHYGSTGELPDFSDQPAIQVAFALFKGEIDFNFERYQEICKKRSEAGKLGGRPKKNAPPQPPEQPAERLQSFAFPELMRMRLDHEEEPY